MKLKLKNVTNGYVMGKAKIMIVATNPDRVIFIGTMRELRYCDTVFFKRIRKCKLELVRDGYTYYNIEDGTERAFDDYLVFQLSTNEKGLSQEEIMRYEQENSEDRIQDFYKKEFGFGDKIKKIK